MNYNRNQIDGDLAVRNNAVIGGDSTIRGNQSVMGDLHVTGSIIGSSVSSKDMGLYLTESALKTAVPTPEVGMYAAVGSTFPASLYRCDVAGTWTATGNDVTYNSPTAVALQVIKGVASSLISNEQTRAEFAEDTIKSLLTAETKERKASNDEVAQMLRRLAVFMSDHHHHHLDADWLWKELLLGASLDTENDILTLMGIKYQLTRYNATPERTGAYTWGDISIDTFAYDTISATTTSASPKLVVTQQKIFDMTDGSTETDTITLTGYTAAYEAVDSADADKVNTSTGVVTFGVNEDVNTSPSVSVKLTITANGKTASKTATATQSKATAKAYYGKSADIPTAIASTDSNITLSNGAKAYLDSRNETGIKCYWVAIPSDANYKVDSVINNTDDPYTMATSTTAISGYTLYYYKADMNIKDYVTITFKTK